VAGGGMVAVHVAESGWSRCGGVDSVGRKAFLEGRGVWHFVSGSFLTRRKAWTFPHAISFQILIK